MNKFVPLQPIDYESLSWYLSDEDVFDGTDGKQYIFSDQLLEYYATKAQLEEMIGEVEHG